MSELLSCPFCGGEARTILDGKWWVACAGCTCEIGFEGMDENGCWGHYDTEAEAINAWNARAERTCECTTEDSAWCFVCSECGRSFPRDKLHLAHNHGEINYCPNCGAKVVE